jgi:hypothetical protein
MARRKRSFFIGAKFGVFPRRAVSDVTEHD